MRPDEASALRNEPNCAHNAGPKSGCAKPQPGATQGGCAFDGARNALLPIADVAHIVHGPIGCAGTSWDGRGSRSSGATLYRIGMTTDLSEMDVIMGRGEKRLFHAIKQAIDSYRPAAVFVYATCVPALHGDDYVAVAKAAQARWGVPVVPVDCAGFYGNKNFGNRIAGDVMLRHVIGTREPDPVPAGATRPGITTHDVNLIGEWNIGGEFWSVAPLFDELGLRILCSFTGDARFREVQTMHRGEANMVVCSKAMIRVAHTLRDRFGTPFFEGGFYGVAATSAALRGFAAVTGRPGSCAANGSAHRARGSGGAGGDPAAAPAAGGQARADLRRRPQILVAGLRDAASRHERCRHRHREIDRGGQGPHPRADGTGRADDPGQRPDRSAAQLPRTPRRHPDRR